MDEPEFDPETASQSPKSALTPEIKHRASQSMIVQTLRGQIVSGKLASGSRLPNRRDLVEHFQASSVTIQRAMDRLIQAGFIHTAGPNGTFVTEFPPHQCRHGLLMLSNPGNPDKWRRFSTVLCDAAVNLPSARRRTMAIYYDVGAGPEADGYKRLVHDLKTQRLAGLVIGGDPSVLFGTPVFEAGAPPCVALIEQAGKPGAPAVGHNRHAFIDKALDYLARRGRRRIAMIMGESRLDVKEYFTSGLTSRGMIHHPYWLQGVFVGHPELSRDLVHLLMHEGQLERPDGLIIYDDNLAEQIMSGLLDAGVRAPQDLDLVTHGNFPWSLPSVMPIHRIGYDAVETLETCLDLIDRQRAGEAVPVLTLIDPREESASGPANPPAERQRRGGHRQPINISA
jgi:DNA-binding LacI/PurR family transcriptional regulator